MENHPDSITDGIADPTLQNLAAKEEMPVIEPNLLQILKTDKQVHVAFIFIVCIALIVLGLIFTGLGSPKEKIEEVMIKANGDIEYSIIVRDRVSDADDIFNTLSGRSKLSYPCNRNIRYSIIPEKTGKSIGEYPAQNCVSSLKVEGGGNYRGNNSHANAGFVYSASFSVKVPNTLADGMYYFRITFDPIRGSIPVSAGNVSSGAEDYSGFYFSRFKFNSQTGKFYSVF